MFTIRPSDERGSANFGWLDSKHSFSFGNYYDANHMGFRNLRVINEDKVLPNQGFGTHGHRDMEIISYVISGSLEHRDSMNNGSVLRSGDVQRMSAGTGIRHSEFNASTEDIVHFLQIWILPEKGSLTPSYEERNFTSQKRNQLCLLVSGNSEDEALHINSPIELFGSELDTGVQLQYSFLDNRHGWIQMIRGSIELSASEKKQTLDVGDGVAISNLSDINITALSDCEFILFDLP